MNSNSKYHTTNRSELARRYKVSIQTLNKWLGLIPDLDLSANQRIFTPKQVSLIIKHLGEPPD